MGSNPTRTAIESFSVYSPPEMIKLRACTERPGRGEQGLEILEEELMQEGLYLVKSPESSNPPRSANESLRTDAR